VILKYGIKVEAAMKKELSQLVAALKGSSKPGKGVEGGAFNCALLLSWSCS
jgi:hypothetical protein